MTIKMKTDGYYGRAIVPKEVFQELNAEFFISGCTDRTKYMCANSKEKEHLKELGIEVIDYCDWFKIELEEV